MTFLALFHRLDDAHHPHRLVRFRPTRINRRIKRIGCYNTPNLVCYCESARINRDLKFLGVDSPQAIQKMLSLVQNSKVKTPQLGSPRVLNQPLKKGIEVKRIPSFTASALQPNSKAEE